MRTYVQFDPSTGMVFAELRSLGIPGPGPGLPADMIDVTDRTDGPWLFRTYDPVSDSFSGPVYEVEITADKQVIQADGTDQATVTFRTTRDNYVGPLTVLVGGVQQVVNMNNGLATLTITSAVPALIKIGLKEHPDFRALNELRIEAT